MDSKKTALIGFVKQDDQNTLSSIGSRFVRARRKKIYPTRFDTKSAANSIYTRPCFSHEKPVSVLPVELIFYMPQTGTWKSLGVGKVCPLCWTVIIKPDGPPLELSSKEQDVINDRVNRKLASGRGKKKGMTREEILTIQRRLLSKGLPLGKDALIYSMPDELPTDLE